MRYKKSNPGQLDIRTLIKDSGRKTTKSRKVPFFNERDYRIFAGVNGITF
ncbi:MAG: hypothetical protein ABFD62_09850 [Syntrophaceae bacterium]